MIDIGKLTQEQTVELLRELVRQVSLEDLIEVLRAELDSTDLSELSAQFED